MKSTVFLFGEAEKGEFGVPLFCNSLADLLKTVGNPPELSQGVSYAIQTLLYNHSLVFCRVQEEGFSIKDYMKGLSLLKKQKSQILPDAIFIPGVGNKTIIEATIDVCNVYSSLLVLTEKDLYDYFTSSREDLP